jgi:hypothetical protein
MDGPVGVAEGLLSQPDITGTVFDQKNLNGHVGFSGGFLV